MTICKTNCSHTHTHIYIHFGLVIRRVLSYLVVKHFRKCTANAGAFVISPGKLWSECIKRQDDVTLTVQRTREELVTV